MLSDLFHGFIALTYPQNCILCKKHLSADSPSKFVCPQCALNIQPNIPPFCPKCSRHLGEYPFNSKCSSCRKNTLHFDFTWCACIYNDHLKKLIHAFKYHQKTYLKTYFTHIMISFIKKYTLDINQFDILLPIPLSATKLRERGYNQSRILAEMLCSKYNIPLSIKNLTRSRNTKSQVLLSKKERWTNIAGAFRIKNSRYFQNKNILLIDDLLTTGATSSEAAKTLKGAGAKTVSAFTLAIAMQ